MSDFLQSHGLQHTRLPCPSLSLGVCLNSCPFSQWCHPTISSSVVPFSCFPQPFPTSGLFLMNWLSASGNQSIEVCLKIILGSKVQGENINAGVTISSYAQLWNLNCALGISTLVTSELQEEVLNGLWQLLLQPPLSQRQECSSLKTLIFGIGQKVHSVST